MAHAGESYAAFLAGLQRLGYGEQAVDYLRSIEGKPDLPDELREMWDLEMAESLQLASREAPSGTVAARWQAEAQALRDKFNREHPNHPAVPKSVVEQGDIALDRGLVQVRLGTAAEGPEARQAAYASARKALADARRSYDQVLAMCRSKEGTEPEIATPLWYVSAEARTKLALVDYWSAEMIEKTSVAAEKTTASTRSPRQLAFDAVAASLATLAQQWRGESAGTVALYWQARALAEAGDAETALEMYDEVLSFAPDAEDEVDSPGEAAFFAEAMLARLQLLRQQQLEADLVAEATAWLEARKKRPEAPGYQAIALELVKSKLTAAELQLGQKRRSARRTILVELANIAKLSGSHQLEALRLLRAERKADGDTVEPAQEIAEILALAAEEERSLMWAEAEEHLNQALAAQKQAGDTTQEAETRERLARLQLRRARWLASQGDWLSALAVAEHVIVDSPETKLAPAIAALGASCAARLLATTTGDEQATARARLEKLAAEIRARWPNHAEADDATIALGQAEATLGQLDAAIARFEAIPATSTRFGQAQYHAGRLLWRQSTAEPENGAGPLSADNRKQLAARAEACLANSLKSASEGAVVVEPRDARAMLAEICLSRNDHARAAQWLAPVVDAYLAASSPETDLALLRSLHAAVRALTALGQGEKARAVVLHLDQTADDTDEVNRVLFDMFRTVLKQSLAGVSAENSDAAAPAAPAPTEPNADSEIDEILAGLAARQHFSAQAQVMLGDLSLSRGDKEQAAEIYRRLIDSAESDPAQAQQAAAHLTRARTRLVRLLREQGEYSRALEEIEIVLTAHPRSLEVALEKGRILEAWSRTDLSRVDAALEQWTEIRLALSKQSPRPPEYFEAVFNAAICLRRQALVNKSRIGLDQAKQLLNATLVTSPKLSGQEMVAQYQKLLGDIAKDQAAMRESPAASP